MKNFDISVRNKFNSKIKETLREKIENLKFCDVENFCIDEGYKTYFEKKYSDIKYILGFKEEEKEILNRVRIAVETLNLNDLVKICDEYEFRFFRIFDYIIDCEIINSKNFKEVYFLFCNLIKEGTTSNSLNLSLFIIGIFDRRGIHSLCRKILHNYIDYVEICGFICQGDYFKSNNIYFNLLRDSYKSFYRETLSELNRFEKLNSKVLILSFYVFKIKDVILERFEILDFKILIEYIINLRKSLNRISNTFLFENKTNEFKNILKDLELVVNNIKKFWGRKLILGNEKDIEFLYLYACLFEDIKEIQIDDRVFEFLFDSLIESIKSRNLKVTLIIIKIYNKFKVNVVSDLSSLFSENYSSLEFGIYILRAFRSYEYFNLIIEELEGNLYLTKLINEFEFRVTLLRSLSLVYSRNCNSIVGVNFLKVFMNQFDFYVEGNGYINFITQKILERSCI